MRREEAELKRLMLLSLDGDAAAWRLLLTKLRNSLGLFFRRRLVGREADAEDLLQECLLAIHAKRATYDPSLPFTAWAYAIAHHKLADHLRRCGRRREVPLDDALSLMSTAELEHSGVRRDLQGLLSRLPMRQRQLIRDARLLGYTLSEAAARNGISEGAAKVSVHRAMKKLSSRVSRNED